MTSSPRREISFLRAFEEALREGVLLDRSLGSILESVLELTEAEAVALLPGAGVPALIRLSPSPSGGTEQTLGRHLEEALAANRVVSAKERGVSFLSLPIRVAEQLSGAFGLAVRSAAGEPSDLSETGRLVALILSHVLERERTIGALIRRRDEAMAATALPTSGMSAAASPETTSASPAAALPSEAAPPETSASGAPAEPWISRLEESIRSSTDRSSILEQGVEAVRAALDLDLCAVRLGVSGDATPLAALVLKSGTATDSHEGIPDALLEQLGVPESFRLAQDVLADPIGPLLLPGPAVARGLPRPIGMVAVPLVFGDEVLGALAGVAGGRPEVFSEATLELFRSAARTLSAALVAARGTSSRFDAARLIALLRQANLALAEAKDVALVKQVLCEHALLLLGAEGSQLFEPEPGGAFLLSSWAGRSPGREAERSLSRERTGHPVIRAALSRILVNADDAELENLEPVSSGTLGSGSLLARAAAVPLIARGELVAVLMVASARVSAPWTSSWSELLSLLSSAGALALRGARFEAALEKQRERDSETGLLHRAGVLKRLDQELKRAERSGGSVALAHGRFDHLKEAIEALGPPSSETLLPQAIAHVLQATRSTNLVGRDQADRFFVVLLDAGKSQAHRALEVMQKTFDRAFEARVDGEGGPRLSLTFGIAAYPEDAFDAPSLASRAEEALDDAVKSGPGSIVFYGALSGEIS
jgi:diguanylate cyclase (GGDEF)-like protein